VARVGERKNTCRILEERSVRKRHFGKPRRSWEDNMDVNLRDIVCDYARWMELVEDYVKWQTLVVVL
jgi:hypothetical protein